MIDEELLRFARLLEAVVRVSKVPAMEIERRLDLGHGTLNRLFSGKIELKLRHILSILSAIGYDPKEFFFLAYNEQPSPQRPALAQELLELLTRHSGPPALSKPAASFGPDFDAELERKIEETLERMGLPAGLGKSAEKSTPAGSRARARPRKRENGGRGGGE